MALGANLDDTPIEAAAPTTTAVLPSVITRKVKHCLLPQIREHVLLPVDRKPSRRFQSAHVFSRPT